MQLYGMVRFHYGLTSLNNVGFCEMFLYGLKAVFMGEALGPERFDFLLQNLLRFQQRLGATDRAGAGD